MRATNRNALGRGRFAFSACSIRSVWVVLSSRMSSGVRDARFLKVVFAAYRVHVCVCVCGGPGKPLPPSACLSQRRRSEPVTVNLLASPSLVRPIIEQQRCSLYLPLSLFLFFRPSFFIDTRSPLFAFREIEAGSVKSRHSQTINKQTNKKRKRKRERRAC